MFWKIVFGKYRGEFPFSWTKNPATELTLLLLVSKWPVDVNPWTGTGSDGALHLGTLMFLSQGNPPLASHSSGGT